jgi:hypothetical protein
MWPFEPGGRLYTACSGRRFPLPAPVPHHRSTCFLQTWRWMKVEIFFTSKFSYLLFCNRTHKSETGIANHLHQSLWWANQKHWAPVRSYLLHSFLHLLLCLVPATAIKLCNYADPKPFSWAKPAYFKFSSYNFTLQDHILSTAGDALRLGKSGSLSSKCEEKAWGQWDCSNW